MRRHLSTARAFAVAGLIAILAANSALGQTLRFAVMGDNRSNFDGSGVNDQAVQAISEQISGRRDISFVIDTGDMQCGEWPVWQVSPRPSIASQLAAFKADVLAGGLIPIGSPGTGVPLYCIRGNHETYDDVSHDQIGEWMNAFGQYLPTNGPTTGDRHVSEVGMTYSFMNGHNLFLGVDEFRNADAAFPAVNTSWVQQQILARSPADQKGFVFVFGHTPLYQIGEETILATRPADRDAFLNTMLSADGPDGQGARVYICGHDHLNAFARIMPLGGGKPFYQVMIGGGGGPVETFDGVYSKDFPNDAGKAVDLYHDSDPGNHIPFHYSYASVNVNGDSLWITLYGSTVDTDQSRWPLLFTLVINGSITTSAAELGDSGVCNDALVVFNQQLNGTYYGVMQGLGRVVKTGPGTLEFTGANTYEGGTTIEEGKLLVNNPSGSGTGTGPVLVKAAGTLGGSGTITGDVTNRGTITPGNSIGTLTISGQYVHQTGAVYEAEVNAAGASDRIRVTKLSGTEGTAEIQGGTVRVLPAAGNYLNGTRYAILTAEGGVTGAFDEVVQPSAILHFNLDMQGNEIDLVLQRNTYASQARTPYQAAVGSGLDQATTLGAGDLRNTMNQLEMMSQADLQIAMTELGPILYDDMTAAALSGARVFSNTLRDRFGTIHCETGIDCRGRDQIWVKDYSNWSSQAGTPVDPPGFRYTTTGGAVGMERCFSDDLTGGVSIGYSGTELVEYEGMGHGNCNTLHTALYATWQPKDYVHVDSALGWGYDWFKNTRPILLFNRAAESSHTGQELTAYLGAGVDYPVGRWTVGPIAAIQYVHVDQSGFQEQNAGDLGLEVDASGANSLQTRIGLETTRPLMAFNHRLIPRLRVEWLHEYCGAIRTTSAQFSGAPDVTFSAPGRRYLIDGAIVGGGIDACLSHNLTAYLNYDVPLLGDSNIISGYSLWLGIGANF